MKSIYIASAVGISVVVLSACIVPPGLRSKDNLEVEVRESQEPERLRLDRWYYVEMEETVCANGTTAGMGLNIGESEQELVIYLNGGGVCWDASSCNLFKTAANMDVTYDAQRLGKELYPLVQSGLLDRHAEVNPWPDANVAFIPYCTGDLHVGRAEATYDSFAGDRPVQHRGAENLEHFIERLAETFPEVEKIWLVGISAGGYGITWNFSLFQDAFEEAEIHAFSDASPWLIVEEKQWAEWKRNWKLDMPRGCVMCDVAPDYVFRYLMDAYPETRFGLSVFEQDATLGAFMRMMPHEVEENLNWFLEERYKGAQTSSFVAPGKEHETLLFLNKNLMSREGQSLHEFLNQWAHGDSQ